MPPTPPLTLIVSARDWLGRSFESVLSSNGYLVLRAYSPHQALEHAGAAVPDLVFIDAEFNGPMSGTDLCRELRARLLVSPDTPLIQISARPLARAERIEALRAGAWEIFSLPLDAEEIVLRLETYLLARLEAGRLREASLVDPVTGLYNVRGILQRVRELGALMARRRTAFACIVFGPDGGDQVTVEPVFSIFQSGCRESDAVGRLGPREFIVLAPDTDQAGATALARRVLTAAEGGEFGRVLLRAGLYAVGDFASASIQPVELLVRATMAFRHLSVHTAADRIRTFGPRGEVTAL